MTLIEVINLHMMILCLLRVSTSTNKWLGIVIRIVIIRIVIIRIIITNRYP